MADFCIKVDFFRRKSATKFLCVKTVSRKVVTHSLAYLAVHKWFVGDIPLNVNFVQKVIHRYVAATNTTAAVTPPGTGGQSVLPLDFYKSL